MCVRGLYADGLELNPGCLFTRRDSPRSSNARLCWQARVRETKKYKEAVAKQARAILAQRGGIPVQRVCVSYTFRKPSSTSTPTTPRSSALTRPR
jgi:hypothetical protein